MDSKRKNNAEANAVMEGAVLRTLVRPDEDRKAAARESVWDAEGFESVYYEYFPKIMAALVRMLGDAGRAEDIANEVFFRLYRQPQLPRPEGNLGGWLYRTAMNLGIDAMRSKARQERYEAEAARQPSEPAGNPLDSMLREERARRVQAVLARMKPAQARILMLRSSGLAYKELAAALGLSLGSVGTMLSRAEACFQKRYRQMFGHGGE